MAALVLGIADLACVLLYMSRATDLGPAVNKRMWLSVPCLLLIAVLVLLALNKKSSSVGTFALLTAAAVVLQVKMLRRIAPTALLSGEWWEANMLQSFLVVLPSLALFLGACATVS